MGTQIVVYLPLGSPCRGLRRCLDSSASPRLRRRVWVRSSSPREPRGSSVSAVYGLDQVWFLSSIQAGNFVLKKKSADFLSPLSSPSHPPPCDLWPGLKMVNEQQCSGAQPGLSRLCVHPGPP